MCTYSFTHRYPAGSSKTCQIQTYFHLWDKALPFLQEQGYEDLEELIELSADLPTDKKGHCIFHSRDLEWKLQHRVALRFEQLLNILFCIDKGVVQLDTQSGFQDIDLRECLFMGEAEYGNLRMLIIDGFTFKTHQYWVFERATFHDKVVIRNSAWEESDLDFKYCTFKESLQIDESEIHKTSLEGAHLSGGLFFNQAKFTHGFEGSNMKLKGQVNIINSTFEREAFFTESETELEPFMVDHCQFSHRLDFSHCMFGADFYLYNSECFGEVRFTNTIFQEPVEIAENEFHENVIFNSTHSDNKLFHNLVRFIIQPEQLTGAISFEQVNFMNIVEEDRQRLLALSRENKVIIGAGCIKYRHQTAPKNIPLKHQHQALAIELANTFVAYFEKSDKGNLGVEILNRDENQISLFYFSDENITEDEFLNRLKHAEEAFLGLIAPKKTQHHSLFKRANVVNLLDSLVNFKSLFFKIGIRLVTQHMQTEDAHTLMETIHFHQKPILPASQLEQILSQHYDRVSILNFIDNVEVRGDVQLNLPENKGQINIAQDQGSIEASQILHPAEKHPHGVENETFEVIRELIQQSRRQEALDQMLPIASELSPQLYQEGLALNARLSQIQIEIRTGILSMENRTQALNLLSESLLFFMDSLEKAAKLKGL